MAEVFFFFGFLGLDDFLEGMPLLSRCARMAASESGLKLPPLLCKSPEPMPPSLTFTEGSIKVSQVASFLA